MDDIVKHIRIGDGKEPRGFKNDDAAPFHFREPTANGFDRQSQMIGDILPAHEEPDIACRLLIFGKAQ
jgi:hypothetical protein